MSHERPTILQWIVTTLVCVILALSLLLLCVSIGEGLQ